MNDISKLGHIGIIMDGNRRFARKLMLEPWKGHEWGARKLEDVLEWCRELNVREVTLYSLSYENFKSRPKHEINILLELIEKEALRAAELEKVHDNKIRFRIIGRPDLFPVHVREALKNLEDSTKNYDGFLVNLAMAYGGRQEILDATKKLVFEAKNGNFDAENLDETTFRKFLYTNGTQDPDMIIRTGGEKRLSGFLLWQSAYSELHFTKKMWPDFGKDDLKEAIEDYSSRKRRFGK